MFTQGAFVIVLNENQQILLVKRKDVRMSLYGICRAEGSIQRKLLRKRQFGRYWKKRDTAQCFL